MLRPPRTCTTKPDFCRLRQKSGQIRRYRKGVRCLTTRFLSQRFLSGGSNMFDFIACDFCRKAAIVKVCGFRTTKIACGIYIHQSAFTILSHDLKGTWLKKWRRPKRKLFTRGQLGIGAQYRKRVRLNVVRQKSHAMARFLSHPTKIGLRRTGVRRA